MTEEQRIREFLQQNFLFSDGAGIGDRDSLLQRGVLDSTGVLELIGFLEREFPIHVEDDEMVPENLDGIERAAEFVRRKRAAAEVSARG